MRKPLLFFLIFVVLNATLALWLQTGLTARQTFAALCGGGVSCAYIAGDVWQASDEAEKTRQNFNYFNNVVNSAEDCDNATTSKVLFDSATKNFSCGTDQTGAAAAGDVVGPASATDNAIVRFDAATGKLVQNSGVTIADGTTGTISGTVSLTGSASGTNTGDVTLAGTPDYITMAGQIITRALINLTTHVVGDLPLANFAQASSATRLLCRGQGAGAGDWQECTIGSGLSMSGTTMTSTGGGGGGAPDDALYVALATDATLVNERVLTAGGNITLTDAGAGGALTIASPNTMGITVDGGGSVLTTGTKGFIVAAANCTITQVTVLSTDGAATTGSIVFDVWKDTYANYPPTNADSITAAAKPALSSANKAQDSTLTGWTPSVTAGDILGIEIESVTAITRATLTLRCQ